MLRLINKVARFFSDSTIHSCSGSSCGNYGFGNINDHIDINGFGILASVIFYELINERSFGSVQVSFSQMQI